MKTDNEQVNRQLIKELYKHHFDDPLFEYWMLEFWEWIDTLTTGRTRNSVPRNPKDLLELESLNLYYEKKIEYCEEKKERIITDKLIPASIVNLKNLKYLLLENFQKLPKEIGQLDSLQELAVIRCEFKELPKVLCNLKNLQSIDIFGSINKFPEEIGNLTSLKILKMTNSRIESLPESIGNLTNLTNFELYRNKYLKALPDSIGNLSSLKVLEVRGSDLETLPETIGNLTQLKTLGLYGNGLNQLPTTITNLTTLDSLDVRENPLPNLPDAVKVFLYDLGDKALSGKVKIKSEFTDRYIT